MSDQVAVVIGGGSGIGAAVARALGRAGTVEDVAAAVRFLLSDDAAWLTGEVLDLNGGAHLRRYPDLLTHITRAFG